MSRRGFTLLEMLVVLAIIGILTALAAPHYASMGPRLRLLSATHEILLDLRQAHARARIQKQEVVLAFDPSDNAYLIDGKPRTLNVSLNAAIDDSETPKNAGSSLLRFYPDGSATPATLSLSSNNRQAVIRIDGLTGRSIVDGQ
jgi:type II secretion system protein H